LAQEAGATVLAVDNSAEALAVAARNAAAAGLESLVRFERGDLLEKVPTSSLHLVVGNPPYVRSGDLVSLAPDIRLFEPEAALDGGPDGLAVFRRLMPEASRVLRPGGSLIVEVGDGQAQMVAEMARAAGFCLTTVHEDLTRRARIVEATLPGAEVMGLEDMDEEGIYHLREALSVGAIIGHGVRHSGAVGLAFGGAHALCRQGAPARPACPGVVPVGGGHRGGSARPRRDVRTGVAAHAPRTLHLHRGH